MKKKGLTLLELMIALSIFSTFSVFMYRFFADEQKSIIAKHRQLDMHYNAVTILNDIESLLRNNPNFIFQNNVFYKDPTRNYVIISLNSGITEADLYFDGAARSLKDRQGNTIGTGIKDIAVLSDGGDNNLISIGITLSYGSGARELQYSVKTTINNKR